MVAMNFSEEYVRICGEVSNFTNEKTGTSFIDAYFGPEALAPERQSKDKSSTDLVCEIEEVIDNVNQEVTNPLQAHHLIGECQSMKLVVEWLDGKKISYNALVEGLFHIPIKRFSESVIDEKILDLEDALKDYPGNDLKERVDQYSKQGEITGNELKHLVENELQAKAIEVGKLFQDKIFSLLGTSLTDNGVEYQTVTGAPWSGYNWYQGGFKSVNEFNLDVTFNRNTIQGVIYHEYEHHVSNLWREKYYLDHGDLKLSVVPLHTGRCVISEGSADTAKEFLGVCDEDPEIEIADVLYTLRRMTSINAAIMLNKERKSANEAVEYLYERGHRPQKSAEASIGFIAPTLSDGRLNFWAPYVFTYFFGRTDFVLPTFQKALENDELAGFYQTLYLNPYSGSSVTWKEAFSWL